MMPFSATMPRTSPTGAVIGRRNAARLVTSEAIADVWPRRQTVQAVTTTTRPRASAAEIMRATKEFGIPQVADGLYVKLVTSATGLIVGIIAHVGYHWLSILVERMVFRMENSAIEFMDILQDN